MKAKIVTISAMIVFTISACKKAALNNICFSVDKTTAIINEAVTTSDCSKCVPPNAQLDWGDGSEKNDGLEGTHKYTTAGTYTIKCVFKKWRSR